MRFRNDYNCPIYMSYDHVLLYPNHNRLGNDNQGPIRLSHTTLGLHCRNVSYATVKELCMLHRNEPVRTIYVSPPYLGKRLTLYILAV